MQSANANLTITGSGDPSDPLIFTVADSPTFQGQNTDGIIGFTPGGPLGHEPVVDITGSPGSDYVIAGDGSGGGEWRQISGGGGGALAVFPFGFIGETGSSSIPAGWLACDGSAVDRVVYADLFAAIGTNYGVGDGSTTFNLPDSRGRSHYGLGTHTDVDALGDNDGLVIANRTPVHLHGSGTLANSANVTGLTVNAFAGNTGNENTSQTGLAAGLTVTEVENCLRDAINADPDCSGATPVQISVAAGGGIVSGAPDAGNHHQHDYSHGHGVTDPGHTHTVSGSTANKTIPYLVVNKMIFSGV